MRIVLAAAAMGWGCALPFTAAAVGASGLYAGFEADAFDPAERHFLEAALVASGDLGLPPDTAWDHASEAALAAFAARDFADVPRNLHAGALAIALLARIDAEGWALRRDPGLGLAMALPEALMDPPEPEEGGTRRWSRDGALTVLTHRFPATGAAQWHAAAVSTNADPARLVMLREPGRLVTRGVLADGRAFHTRSEREGADWATVYIAAEPGMQPQLELIAASITAGPMGEPGAAPWRLPPEGRLSGLLETTVDLLQALAGAVPPRGMPPASPPASPSATDVTGTGFFVTDQVLVTASHVVGDCTRVTLADGTELRPLGTDHALDVAAFASAAPAPAWFAISPSPRARLGQRVHAAGFPYYSIVGTALHLTGGNVSALSGVNDDGRFFSFTAPVQPGNSGGPLIDAEGRVMGLVVSRLSEEFIVGETGSLPQNMNYALGSAELTAFLERIGAPRPAGGLAAFDMDAGAPEGLEKAVVPVICL